MTIFQFELKKLLLGKKFLLLMFCLIIGVVLLFFRNHAFQEEIIKEELRAIDAQIQMSRTNNRMHLAQLEQDPHDQELQQMEKANDDIYAHLYELLSLYTESSWQENLQEQNELWKKTIAYSDLGGETVFSQEKMTEYMALNEELLNRNIAPEDERFSIALPNFLFQMIEIWIHGGALLLVLVIIGDLLSAEFDTHSIKLLFTQPIKKTSIITSKLITALIAYMTMLFLVILTAIAVSFLFGEKGSLSYPLIRIQDGSFEFISIASYMAKGLIVTTTFMLFMIALILTYSILAKNSLLTLGLVMITALLGYGMTMLPILKGFLWANPFIYLWPHEQINALSKDWYMAIPITILYIVCLYFFSRHKMKNAFVGS